MPPISQVYAEPAKAIGMIRKNDEPLEICLLSNFVFASNDKCKMCTH